MIKNLWTYDLESKHYIYMYLCKLDSVLYGLQPLIVSPAATYQCQETDSKTSFSFKKVD